MDSLKKIVITGPESSGKSWLSQQLGLHYQKPYVLEYARFYLEENGPRYDFDTLETIIRGHLQFQQKHLTTASDLIFLDTDLINFKVWEEVVFGKSHDFLDEAIANEADHVYLLTSPDLPWEADPLRENPQNRLEIFERHKSEIERLGREYEVVRGIGEKRLWKAIEASYNLIK